MTSLPAFFEQVALNAAILFDDVIVLAKPAIGRIGDAASAAKVVVASAADDSIALAKPAMKKTAAVVVDDTAVSSSQINAGAIAQHREYAVWSKIVAASLANKVVITGVIMIAGVLMPVLPKIMLAFGGAYLAYEGAHKMVEYVFVLRNKLRALRGLPPLAQHHGAQPKAQAQKEFAPQNGKVGFIGRFLGQEPKERAVLVDLILLDAILSTEILLVANGTLGEVGAWMQAFALVVVGFATTLGVYGVVLAIIRVDNIAGYFAAPDSRLYRPRFAAGLMRALPPALRMIGIIGTIAMLGVAGDVLGHLLPEAFSALSWIALADGFHALSEGLHHALGVLPIGGETFASMTVGLGLGLVMMAVASAATCAVKRLRRS